MALGENPKLLSIAYLGEPEMTFSLNNRVKSVLALLLTVTAMPAFADSSTPQNAMGNAQTSATDAADSAQSAAISADKSAKNAANSADTATNNAANNMTGNAAGMAGSDKSAMDTALGKGACSNDVQQFCNSITPGQGRVAACLHSHNDAISSTCQTQLKTAANEFKTMRKACKNDVQKYCKGAEAGNGGVMSCLKQHEDQLSSSCKSDTENFQTTG
jgi:hypothetical protein